MTAFLILVSTQMAIEQYRQLVPWLLPSSHVAQHTPGPQRQTSREREASSLYLRWPCLCLDYSRSSSTAIFCRCYCAPSAHSYSESSSSSTPSSSLEKAAISFKSTTTSWELSSCTRTSSWSSITYSYSAVDAECIHFNRKIRLNKFRIPR